MARVSCLIDSGFSGWLFGMLMRSTVLVLSLCSLLTIVVPAMADENERVISLDGARLVTDGVMGGVSSGELQLTERAGRSCLQLSGGVSTENNGGFIQVSVPLDASGAAVEYDGIRIEVLGNGETYNLHLRTTDLWLPWQSYRADFVAGLQWRRIDLPFDAFKPYRIDAPLRIEKIKRIGVVAIGRNFEADICIGRMVFYRGDSMSSSD